MTFSEIKQNCVKAKVSITTVAEESGLTYEGLKRGINTESLAIRYIPGLCKSLGITPNDFFGYQNEHAITQTQNGGIGNTQFMDAGAVSILQDQLKKKDEQISMLLQLLNK